MIEFAHHVAQWKANQVGCNKPVGWVDDAWGGYYQCGTPDGLWTFRLKPNGLIP